MVDIQDLSTDLVGKGFSMIESVRVGIATKTQEVVDSANKIVEKIKIKSTKRQVSVQVLQNQDRHQEVSVLIEEIDRLNPRSRLDFCIQEGVLENPYLSALAVQ